MRSSSTRAHMFLLSTNTYSLVEQEPMCSCWTGTNTCALIWPRTRVLAQKEHMWSCSTCRLSSLVNWRFAFGPSQFKMDLRAPLAPLSPLWILRVPVARWRSRPLKKTACCYYDHACLIIFVFGRREHFIYKNNGYYYYYCQAVFLPTRGPRQEPRRSIYSYIIYYIIL